MFDFSWLQLPKIRDGYKPIFIRNFWHFKKNFWVSFVWVILEPLMYLGAIGYGLGSYIQTIQGLSYVDFFFPGLLASTAMMVPFFEGTYTNYSKLTYQKTYSHMLLTPLDPIEVVTGELLWSTFKGAFGIAGLILVSSLFGLIGTWKIILAFFVLVLGSWLFSSLAMIVTTMAKSYDSFVYSTSGFLIPMSLISGLYFPISQMPLVLQIISYILPLSHLVELVRMLLVEDFSWWSLLHLTYLLSVGYILFVISIRRMNKRLIN